MESPKSDVVPGNLCLIYQANISLHHVSKGQPAGRFNIASEPLTLWIF
jgi:hypothetical protein